MRKNFKDFEALVLASERALGALEAACDELLAAMQRPAAKRAVLNALEATPDRLGRAAVAAAREPRRSRRTAKR